MLDLLRNGVHSAILSAQSPVFCSALLGSGTEKAPLHFDDVDEDAFEVFLQFLYTGASTRDTPEAPLDLYTNLAAIAHRFGAGSGEATWTAGCAAE
eukprot:m51a1_g13198 hypothetical protein (96) ;mRNA; r:2280-2698